MVLKILNDWFKRSNKAERLWLLAKIEFKLRYYENKLGLLWALIKPLMDMIPGTNIDPLYEYDDL